MSQTFILNLRYASIVLIAMNALMACSRSAKKADSTCNTTTVANSITKLNLDLQLLLVTAHLYRSITKKEKKILNSLITSIKVREAKYNYH